MNEEINEAVPNDELNKTGKQTKKTAIGNFESIEEFTKDGFKEIVAGTRAVNAFPQGTARDLYCSYAGFRKVIDQQSNHILGIISNVLKMQNVRGNIQRRQQDEQFEMVQECNDTIMERLNLNLDEVAGIKRNSQTVMIESHIKAIPASNSTTTTSGIGKVQGSWNLRKHESNPLAARLITAKNIARPQIKFRLPIDNRATTPFIPKLKDKPNSLKPLAILPEYDDDGNEVSYLHPYEFELMKFDVPAEQLKRKSPQTPLPLKETELVFVDTVPKLNAALEELRQHKEIAIDVEHHSYRTFLGFTCLVQMSTRHKDYIFDALELRDDMHILNAVLTDPRIVKILHGADLDIIWLQRDLSLYIVNMFDTYQAAKILDYARLSLAYLLKHYCDIEADKTFQLADWRMRPLPEELITYARQDTHFLIYIYESMTNDVLDAGNQQAQLLRTVYQHSTELCKRRYAKPTLNVNSHLDIVRKSNRIFDNRQLHALREIYCWRDEMARKDDESLGYVLPNHMLLQIAESLPREMQGILACCSPIPPHVRQNLHALHQIVLRAREQPLVKPIIQTAPFQRVAATYSRDYNSKLYCPHDLSHCDEISENRPTLLDSKQVERTFKAKLSKPAFAVLDAIEVPSREQEESFKRKCLFGADMLMTPYQRYLAILPQVEKENREEAERIAEINKMKRLCPTAESMLPTQNEPDEEQPVDKDYNLPIKEMLKRKYEESVAKKAAVAAANNHDSPKAKRARTWEDTNADKLKFVNLPPTKKELQQAAAAKKPNCAEKKQQIIVVDDSDAPDEMPSTSLGSTKTPAVSTQSQTNKKTTQKFRNRNQKKKMKTKNHPQSSDKPVVTTTNFDYKKVDFKKFQGGAQHAKGTQLKPQFHGKGNANKANNKKFNKLFTFSNVKANKK